MPRSSSGTRNVARSLATRDVGHHRDEQAAGLADAVDRGDHRRRAVADGEERQDLVADVVGQPVVARLVAAAEVAARREHVAGAGDDQRGEVGVGVDEAHGPLDAVVHRRGEGVAGRRPVDHAPGDDALALEAQAGGAELVGHQARSCSASAALCSVFSARRMWAASTSRPSRPMAPTPSASDRAVGLDRLPRPSATSSAVGENTSLAIGIWPGWIAHLPSKPSRLACVGAAPVAVGVLVGGVGRVDGVDAGGPRRGDDLEAGEVPEVAGVLADRVEVAVDPGPHATPTGRRRRR